MTGEQVRQALEHSARFFLPYEAGRSLESLEDKRIPGYNFESASGVTYVMDIRRAPGDRIVNLCFQGKPIDPARKFRVAVNNYRRAGGGGYKMFKDCPVLSQGSMEIRDLIIEWIEKHHEIPTEADGNWRIESGEQR
jgi:2',3'-cyclic-nucleotide 2'-phosphodiesterase/3'-nucleotidase